MATPGLISLPLEILYQIVEDEEITLSDLKNLRLSHSCLGKVLAPRLFHRIGFTFTRKLGVAVSKALSKRNTKNRLRRMEVLPDLKDSEVARTAQIFCIKLHHAPSDVPDFVKWFWQSRIKLDEVFPNIRAVEFDVQLWNASVPDSAKLMRALGQYAVGKQLDIGLWGITQYRKKVLAAVPPTVRTLRISTPPTSNTNPTEKTVKDVCAMLERCTQLKQLDISGFGYRIKGMLDNMPPAALAGIESVRVKHKFLTERYYPFNRDPWAVQFSEGGWDRGLLNAKVLAKLPNLKRIEVEPSESDPFQTTFRPLWDDLRSPSSSIRLESITAAKASDSLFAFLADPSCTSRLEEFRLRVSMESTQAPTSFSQEKEKGVPRWGKCFFETFLPQTQSTIRRLHFAWDSKQSHYGIYNPGWHWRPKLEEDTNNVPYFRLVKLLSFQSYGLEYDFPRLEQLYIGMVWETGAFEDFMKMIRNAPRLRDILLSIDAHRKLDLPRESGFPAAEEIVSEIQDWRALKPLSHTVCMEVRVNAIALFKRLETIKFELRGKKWNLVARKSEYHHIYVYDYNWQ